MSIIRKFNEDLNVAVFTTKFILIDKLPILNVYHHEEDGAWEFTGAQVAKEKDYMLVSLKKIIDYDHSVLDLVDLPLGSQAHRKDKESPWIFSSAF